VDRGVRGKAAIHEQRFAEEVRRIGRGYFVQTPHKHFAIESDTLAPSSVALLRPFNSHIPDFNLPTVRDMQRCLSNAAIHGGSVSGLTKSIMAVRRI
jgi:hypothetical protein